MAQIPENRFRQGNTAGNGRPGDGGVIFNVGRTMRKNNDFKNELAMERRREDEPGYELI